MKRGAVELTAMAAVLVGASSPGGNGVRRVTTLTPFRERRFACILSNYAYLTVFPRGPHQEHQHYLMSNRSVPNLEERVKHASEARKLMLAKFKTSLAEGPAAIEKRQQRQAIAVARAERAVQREETRQRQERDLAKQAEIAAQAAAAARAAADEAAREAAEQAERDALLEAEQKAARDARYAARKQQRKSGGVATKPEARRIAANIAKLPSLLTTAAVLSATSRRLRT
jgi:hypothetical protein